MVLISNDRTSASKKINGMALIRTLTVSTATFERTKEKFDGFRQTEYIKMHVYVQFMPGFIPFLKVGGGSYYRTQAFEVLNPSHEYQFEGNIK